MADQNFRVKRGLEVGVGGTVITAASTGNVGIGSTVPTSKLYVVGDGYFTGVVSATSFYGSGSNLTDLIGTKLDGLKIQNEGSSIGAGSSFTTLNFIADYVNAVGVGSTANITFSNPGFATTSGIATNLKGGSAGNVPYQSATDTTTFVTNGTSGQVLLFNGSVPVWGNVSGASGIFGGITVQDEGATVGTATSVATLNFRGLNVVATATTGASGIATITIADSLVGTGLSISGISTLGVVTSGNIFSTGIVTASQFSTGSGTLGITTNTISGPSEITIDPAAVGDNTGAVRIKGDLYVDGTQFVVNSTTIELADFNVGIATTVGTNALLDGAGIGIGSTNIRKSITWNNTASALTSSEDWNLASGKQYKINGTSVLTSTTLGSGVVNSSLTSVGILGQLSVSGVSTFTNGPVFIGAATSTGTASQRLQVTGGAYVSSNVGVAVTSPSFAVDVSGDARVQSTGKMRFGGTSGTTNFYIQYNSTANSLDFVAG